MRRPIPRFASDEEAERFVGTADLSGYDFSEFRRVRFAFAAADELVGELAPAEAAPLPEET